MTQNVQAWNDLLGKSNLKLNIISVIVYISHCNSYLCNIGEILLIFKVHVLYFRYCVQCVIFGTTFKWKFSLKIIPPPTPIYGYNLAYIHSLSHSVNIEHWLYWRYWTECPDGIELIVYSIISLLYYTLKVHIFMSLDFMCRNLGKFET